VSPDEHVQPAVLPVAKSPLDKRFAWADALGAVSPRTTSAGRESRQMRHKLRKDNTPSPGF
jgi:hypothetical protein